MKEMTVGQKTLHEIAMDAERTRRFLIGVALLTAEARRGRAIPFVFGVVVGVVVGYWL